MDELPRGALTELVEVPGGGDDFVDDASGREHAAELVIIGGREHVERAIDAAVEDGDRGEVGNEPGDAIIGIEAGGSCTESFEMSKAQTSAPVRARTVRGEAALAHPASSTRGTRRAVSPKEATSRHRASAIGS